MWLSFAALDVWFFRDGRPFDAGDAHVASSQFPPPPETMLGATRAILIEAEFQAPRADGLTAAGYLEWLGTLPKEVKPDDPALANTSDPYVKAYTAFGVGTSPGQLELAGPFVAVDEPGATEPVVVVTAPRDLLKKGRAEELLTLTPLVAGGNDPDHPFPGVTWNRGLPVREAKGTTATRVPPTLPLVTHAAEVDDLEGIGWITTTMLSAYLAGDRAVSPANPPFSLERRAGIALGPERTVRTGHFYMIDLVRPRTSQGYTRLLARVEPGPVSGTSWRLPLGGEGKTALATAVDADPAAIALDQLLDPNSTEAGKARDTAARTGWLRVVLLQPALFGRGWLPDGVSADGALAIGPYTFTLQAAATSKAHAISGWDLRKREPKPLRQAAPAGSVYYFRIEETDAARRQEAAVAFWEKHHGQTALQEDTAAGQAGYGLAVVGACRPEKVGRS